MKKNVKNNVFCLVLILSFFVFFACASQPSESTSTPASSSAPSSASTPTPAPSASTPAPTPQQPSNVAASRTTDLILDGSETYTVVWGDTLSKISRNKYSNGFYYPLIMMASNNVIRDQDSIEPGMRLTIPKLQANLDDPRARESIKKYILEIASLTERKRPLDAAGLRRLANSL